MYGTSTIIRRILGIASTMELSAPKASTGPTALNYTRIIMRYRRNWGQAQITGVKPKERIASVDNQHFAKDT